MQEIKQKIKQLRKIYSIKSVYGAYFGCISPIKSRLARRLLMSSLILICIFLAFGENIYPNSNHYYIYLIVLFVILGYCLFKKLKESNQLNNNGHSDVYQRINCELNQSIATLSKKQLIILKETFRMEYLKTDITKNYFPWVIFFKTAAALTTISIGIRPLIDVPFHQFVLVIVLILFSFWYLFRLVSIEIKRYQTARDQDLYLLLFALKREGNKDSFKY